MTLAAQAVKRYRRPEHHRPLRAARRRPESDGGGLDGSIGAGEIPGGTITRGWPVPAPGTRSRGRDP